MFTDSHLDVDQIRNNETEGLWAVRRGTLQWAAWVNWYYAEFGKLFYPEWLTVLYEWPPSHQLGADRVAVWLSDIRDSNYGKEHIGGRPVPRHPEPWDGSKALPAFVKVPERV